MVRLQLEISYGTIAQSKKITIHQDNERGEKVGERGGG